MNTGSTVRPANAPPVLAEQSLPASWQTLLETVRPAFRRAPTFAIFVLVSTGLVAQTAWRTVVDMLAGAGMAAVVSFDIEVVVDDKLFRRWGRKVFGAFWTHDGSAQAPSALGRGNRWVIVGIVVTLSFCSRPVCLPVLFRLWHGKGTASPVRLAGELIGLLAKAFAGRAGRAAAP